MNADPQSPEPPPWRSQTEALGAFIRAHRQLADLSLREMAAMTDVSNAYLSQIERGLHQPSVRVLSAIAQALRVSPEELLAEAGLRGPEREPAPTGAGERGEPAESGERGESPGAAEQVSSTIEAIRADPRLTADQRQALIGVYRSFTGEA